VFRDADLPASLNDGNPFASFQLDRAQMLDDCFRLIRGFCEPGQVIQQIPLNARSWTNSFVIPEE